MSKKNLFPLFHEQALTSQLLVVFTACLLLLGCNSKNPKTGIGIDGQSEFYGIDFVKCFNTEQQMFISEIADTVEYIELKTPYDIVIANIRDVILFGDSLLLKSMGIVYLFHKSGQFIRQIGAKGQGPGEYLTAIEIAVDKKKKEIIVQKRGGLLYYNFDGVFLRSINHPFYFVSFGEISDSIIWYADQIATNEQKYKAFAIPSNGDVDTLTSIPNEYYGKKTSGDQAVVLDIRVFYFYHYNGSLYFKGNSSNDMIWKLSGLDATPYAHINMGKYKLPFEYEPWVSHDEYMRNSDRYLAVKSVQEDDSYFFLFSLPKVKIVYDKKTKKGFTAKDKHGAGLTDDILGGPPLWPIWASDDYYMNAIEAVNLLEEVEAGDYSPAAPLKELLSRIDEDTNQILILCRKKK